MKILRIKLSSSHICDAYQPQYGSEHCIQNISVVVVKQVVSLKIPFDFYAIYRNRTIHGIVNELSVLSGYASENTSEGVTQQCRMQGLKI